MLLLSYKLFSGWLTFVGFEDWEGGGGKGEAAEGEGVLTLLLMLLAGDVVEAKEEAGWLLRPWGGGGRSCEGGDGTFRPCISAASFSSVALRSATKSAMSASRSFSSSSLRDSGVRGKSVYLSSTDSGTVCILKTSAKLFNSFIIFFLAWGIKAGGAVGYIGLKP